MAKKIFFGLAVCLFVLTASNARATQYVLDTGDPAERVCNPRSYTDLGNGIVQDNVTGLEWMKETAPDTYSWQQALDYVAAMNAGTYENYGYTDWRLPTVEELSTLVDAGRYDPAIDPVFSTVANVYWSSTTYVYGADGAWCVYFSSGFVGCNVKSDTGYVRAVRGEPYGSFNPLVSNGDGTVTDPNSGLMWQQCSFGQIWSAPEECTGTATPQNWQQALDYVQTLNDANYLGYNDWRLPSRNELQSIVDYSRYNPATTFPNTVLSNYWSSTTHAFFTGNAWYADFYFGSVYDHGKSGSYYVRAVRGGQCRSFGDCVVAADCTDNLFCTGVETCVAGACVDGPGNPCEAGETCDEGIDECICDLEWDLDGDCDVDKDDSKLLSLRQKDEKTSLSNRHKAEKAAMKAAIGSSGDCDAEWDLDDDCDVDKDDAKLLSLRQKSEKTALSNRHKAEKAAMKAAL